MTRIHASKDEADLRHDSLAEDIDRRHRARWMAGSLHNALSTAQPDTIGGLCESRKEVRILGRASGSAVKCSECQATGRVGVEAPVHEGTNFSTGILGYLQRRLYDWVYYDEMAWLE